MEHKWNLHLETVDGPVPMVETIEGVEPVKMVCVEGGMTYPIVPSARIKWKYFNNIGFGETCQEFALISAKRVDVCNMKENQAFDFDQAIIEVTTSETLPTFVYTFGRLTHAGLKVLLYPYQVALPGLPVVPTNKIQVKLN